MENRKKSSLMLCLSKLIRMGGMARRYLVEAKRHENALIPGSHKAFMMATENQYYLQQLEVCDFNVFDSGLNKPSFLKVPFKMSRLSRKGKFMGPMV